MANDFNKAAEKARQRDAARNNGGEVPAELATGDEQHALALSTAGMLSTGAAQTMEKLKSGAWEAAPQIFDIKEGQTLVGLLEGNGPPADLIDIRTKEPKQVPTWIISSLDGSGVRVSILTTAQLDRKLPPFVGGPVSITKGGTIDTNSGGRVTEFLVAGPKRADGRPRDWSQRAALPEGKPETKPEAKAPEAPSAA